MKGTKEQYLDENYAKLGIAIVEQACKDAMMFPKEVRNFFCNEDSIFAFCMPHTDGRALLDQVYENFEKYGSYLPPSAEKNMEGDIEMNDEEEDIEWSSLLA